MPIATVSVPATPTTVLPKRDGRKGFRFTVISGAVSVAYSVENQPSLTDLNGDQFATGNGRFLISPETARQGLAMVGVGGTATVSVEEL